MEHSVHLYSTNGKPSTYNAIPNSKTNSSSSFKIFYFGEASVNVEQKTLLLVGRTGTGKSTLINSLFNYIVGVKWNDGYRYNFIQEEPQPSNKSKTQIVTAYTLHHKESYRIPYTLTVVDTPGFENSSKHLSDKTIADQIRCLFDDIQHPNIRKIHAVGYAVPASLQTFGNLEHYIYRTLQTLFGLCVSDSLYFLITFADIKPPAHTAILSTGLHNRQQIHFNNCALFFEKHNTNTEYDEDLKQLYWKRNQQKCQDLLFSIWEVEELSTSSPEKTLTHSEDLNIIPSRIEKANVINEESLGVNIQLPTVPVQAISADHETSLMSQCEGFLTEQGKVDYINKKCSFNRCPMTMQKNWRQYIGTVSRGEEKRLQGDDSEVSLDIPQGAPSVYLCRVHTDHTRFTRHGIVPESECIIGPFVEFEFKQLQNKPDDKVKKSPEAFFEICIPHCLPEPKLWKNIKVRHGNTFPGENGQGAEFHEIPSKANEENTDMYYEITEKFINIFTREFCHFICTACNKKCNPKTLILLFGNLKILPEEITAVEIKAYLCSNLYSIQDYKSNLVRSQAEDNLHKLKERSFTLKGGIDNPAAAHTKLKIQAQPISRKSYWYNFHFLKKIWEPTVKNHPLWEPNSRSFVKDGILGDVMDFHGCHSCHVNYPHEAMFADMEFHQRVTEFKGILEIQVESSQEKFPFSIDEITNELTDEMRQPEKNNNLQENKVLSDSYIVDLTHTITEETQLRYLGVELGVPLNVIDTAFTNNHRSITDAAYYVIKTWRQSQTDENVACQNLQIALRRAKQRCQSQRMENKSNQSKWCQHT